MNAMPATCSGCGSRVYLRGLTWQEKTPGVGESGWRLHECRLCRIIPAGACEGDDGKAPAPLVTAGGMDTTYTEEAS